MPDFNLAVMGVLGYLIVVFCVVIAVLWVLLPFFVFAIKNRMDDMVNLQEELINIMRKDR